MLNKKRLALIGLVGIIFYILYVFIFYPYRNFEELDTAQANNEMIYLLNEPHSLSLYELNSHYVNMTNNPTYKNAYNNPLNFKNYYLSFLEKNTYSEDQLYLTLKLSCNLPPKNQLNFYEKVASLLSQHDVDQSYFEIFAASMSDCVASGHSFLPTGSYFWIPYLKDNYQVLGEISPELKIAVDSFIQGRTFTRYLSYKFGHKDS